MEGNLRIPHNLDMSTIPQLERNWATDLKRRVRVSAVTVVAKSFSPQENGYRYLVTDFASPITKFLYSAVDTSMCTAHNSLIYCGVLMWEARIRYRGFHKCSMALSIQCIAQVKHLPFSLNGKILLTQEFCKTKFRHSSRFQQSTVWKLQYQRSKFQIPMLTIRSLFLKI
jgi:hypothetical protein